MNNPLHILQTLDRHLTAPTEITLFGRAALALGYAASPAAFAATHDVDRQDFLKTLAEACQKTDWQVHAYCLMRNHFHMVLETPTRTWSRACAGF